VVDAAYFGAASTSTGIIAPGLPGHRDANLYDYDPDRARELLARRAPATCS
jgi:peptide/nickel transport system substrate-binding protein